MNPLPPASRRLEGAETVFTLSLEPDLPACRGHFPGDPVVPGVVQVDWAIRLGETAFGPLGVFAGLDQVKFLAPLRPGGAVELRLALGPARDRLSFQYVGAAGRHSSGQVRFQPAP